MTLYQFNAIHEIEKAEAVWDGSQVGERRKLVTIKLQSEALLQFK